MKSGRLEQVEDKTRELKGKGKTPGRKIKINRIKINRIKAVVTGAPASPADPGVES